MSDDGRRAGSSARGVSRRFASSGSHSWQTQCSGRHLVPSADGLANRVASGSADLPVGESDVQLGPPTIDLFANRFNSQLPRYMSPCPDSRAVSTDALMSPWPQEVCYAFPPTTILQLVCVKLLQERPRTLLLVAPIAPAASWFPTLARWATSVTPIPLRFLSLHQPHWDYCHPSPDLLSLGLFLIACPV